MHLLLSTSSLRQASMLVGVMSVALFTSAAQGLPEPKVGITYSLETRQGGAYWQKISDTPSGLGDVEYVVDTFDSMDEDVTVLVDNPLFVTMEFTADAPGGNIVDGPVELTGTTFERVFEIDAAGLTLVTTMISTRLERIGTGTLSGSTITWDNVIAPYQEDVIGEADCTGFACVFAGPWPKDLDGIFDVTLPDFTLFTNSTFGDEFVSDNGTANDPSDDIDRPDPDATVKDTWYGVAVPEPRGGILMLAGLLGLLMLPRPRSSSAG